MEKINRKIAESREFALKNADTIVAVKFSVAKTLFALTAFVYLFASLVVAGKLSSEEHYPVLLLLPLLTYPLFVFSALTLLYTLSEYRYRTTFAMNPPIRYAVILLLTLIFFITVVTHVLSL